MTTKRCTIGKLRENISVLDKLIRSCFFRRVNEMEDRYNELLAQQNNQGNDGEDIDED